MAQLETADDIASDFMSSGDFSFDLDPAPPKPERPEQPWEPGSLETADDIASDFMSSGEFSVEGEEQPAPAPDTTQPEEPETTGKVLPEDITAGQLHALLYPTPKAEEAGPFESVKLGYERGIRTVLRGLGLAEPGSEKEKAYFEILKERRPYTTGAGELIGESVPFIGAGAVGGKVGQAILPKLGAFGERVVALSRTLGGRLGISGTTGAVEGGILASGKGEDAGRGAVEGGVAGVAIESVAPRLGRIVNSFYRKVTGKKPAGALIDGAGNPSPELNEVLENEGMTLDDFTQHAADLLDKEVPADQAVRSALFEEAGVRATRGEITKKAADEGLEARIEESTRDELAEPFRQYKARQSEEIESYLSGAVNKDVFDEETGGLIIDAVAGRKSLLKTEKNELYKEFYKATENAGEIPLFTDTITAAIPDPKVLNRLSITGKGPIKELNETLMTYGVMEPSEDFLKKGIEPEILTATNFEDFRQTINQIEKKAKQQGQESVLVASGPIKRALDAEIDGLAESLKMQGFPDEIIEPLKQARERVRTLKTEFSPKSAAGKLIDVKPDGVTAVTEASKLYNSNIAAKSIPVENVRKIMSTLRKAGDKGKAAIGSLQSTVMMDIINAGYGTKSKQINGKAVFNPIAFKNRVEAIGKDKMKSIFFDNPEMLKKINNIDKISSILIRNAKIEPKGSSSTILDLFDKLGFAKISSLVPVAGPMFNEVVKTSLERNKTRKEVKDSLLGTPELKKYSEFLDSTFPGIARALGVSAYIENEE